MNSIFYKDYLSNNDLKEFLDELESKLGQEIDVITYVKKLFNIYCDDETLKDYTHEKFSKYYILPIDELNTIINGFNPLDKVLVMLNIYLLKFTLDNLNNVENFEELSLLNQKRAIALGMKALTAKDKNEYTEYISQLDDVDNRLVELAYKEKTANYKRVLDLDKYGITKNDVDNLVKVGKTKTPKEMEEYLNSLPENISKGLRAFMGDFVGSVKEENESIKVSKPFIKTEDGIKILDNTIFEEPLNYAWDLSDLFGSFLKVIIDGIDFDVAKELRQDSKATHEKLLNLAIKDGIDMSKMSFANDYCNLWSSLKGYAKVVGRIFDYPKFYEDFANGKNEQLTKEITLIKGNEYNTDDLYKMLDFFTYTYGIIGDDMARLGIIDDLSTYKSILNEPYDSRTVEEKVNDAFKCMNEDSSKNPNLKGAVWTCVNVANAYQKVISLFGELYDDKQANYNIGSWNDWFKEKNIEGFSIK